MPDVPPINISIDWSQLSQFLVDGFMGAIKALLQPVPLDFAQWLADTTNAIQSSLGQVNFLTHNPIEWTVGSDDVLRLWSATLLWQVGIAGVVLAIQGYRVSAGQADIIEVLFRTGFLMLVGFCIPLWLRPALSMTNVMADAVYATPTSAEGQNQLVLVLLSVLATVFAVLAWVKGAVGVVFIDVLVVTGPTVFSISALPWFGGLGQWWAKEMTTWWLRPFFVALAIRLGLGIGSHFPGPIEVILAIVSFWLAWTMDTRIRSFSVGAWGSLAQMNLFARGAGMVAGAFAPAAATASPALAAPSTP